MNFNYSSEFLAEKRRPILWLLGAGVLLFALYYSVPVLQQWLINSFGAGLVGAGVIAWLEYQYYRNKPYLSIANGELKKHGLWSHKAMLEQIKKISKGRHTITVHHDTKKLKIDMQRIERSARQKLLETLQKHS